VPAGTPPAIAARLNTEIGRALRDDKVRTSFIEQAQDPVGGTPEQFAKLVREDYDKYERLVKELNIKAN
jgi:tripartite-type tricarboxylate transporter receptor subunit TctC